MRNRIRKIAITAAIALMTCLTALPVSARGWEPLKAAREDARLVVREAEIEVSSAPGVIQVSSNRAVQIKIFTILGRIVSSETLQPGIMQFRVPAHGVYIVKAGTLTCKVAV